MSGRSYGMIHLTILSSIASFCCNLLEKITFTRFFLCNPHIVFNKKSSPFVFYYEIISYYGYDSVIYNLSHLFSVTYPSVCCVSFHPFIQLYSISAFKRPEVGASSFSHECVHYNTCSLLWLHVFNLTFGFEKVLATPLFFP